MNTYIRYAIIAILSTAFALFVYNVWLIENMPPYIPYSDLISKIKKNEVSFIHLKGNEVRIVTRLDEKFSSYAPDVAQLMNVLHDRNVTITAENNNPSELWHFLNNLLPMLILLGGWLIYVRFKSGKMAFSNQAMSQLKPDKSVTFNDVAGIPEAKEELQEIVEFLKNPKKYKALGGRIPKGVLLQGLPGTGKTLLAKAIAGEANVPFYSISGSDFVEMYVGVGASRVREIFRNAKKHAPCIIFIDEIDAVGRSRTAAENVGGQDEREQTLNALLVEMDGFGSNETIIVVAATNRPDILDPALLRPGRFDRQIIVPLPDIKGRLEILKVYAKRVKLAPKVDLEGIAQKTPGFSGADLANLVNEAALAAARKGKSAIENVEFEEAQDKITMGIERKSLMLSQEERKVTAYHEAGHAILAKILPKTDPLNKISIIPRGRALGITQQIPIDDRHTYSLEYLINRIMILMGGKIAEELVLNQQTTGASNDLHLATNIATKMVCEWGMSRLGPITYSIQDEGFIASFSKNRNISEAKTKEIDDAISEIIFNCYNEAKNVLRENIELLNKLANTLLLQETLEADDLDIFFQCYYSKKSKKDKDGLVQK